MYDSKCYLTAAEFSKLMNRVGPFETAPHIAVAVSGGSDSLALCLLVADWARKRKGLVTAITIDHGLRPESSIEAKQVSLWMRQQKIEHKTIHWTGIKPKTGIQAAARLARLRLLVDWCIEHSVIHLLTGHQLEDQAGTVLLRLSSGSGSDGLAAMPLVQSLVGPGARSIRLLRPLLNISNVRLKATLDKRNHDYIEDPSNQNPIYTRTHLLASLGKIGRKDLVVHRLGRLAHRMGQDRLALETGCGEGFVRCVKADPAGFFYLDRSIWRTLPNAIALRILIRLISSVGTKRFGPQLAKVENLWEELHRDQEFSSATLAGARIISYKKSLLVCREPRSITDNLELDAGAIQLWDGRFRIYVPTTVSLRGKCTVGKLGSRDWINLKKYIIPGKSRVNRIPIPVFTSLPAVRDLDGVAAVPHLNYVRDLSISGCLAIFSPANVEAKNSFSQIA